MKKMNFSILGAGRIANQLAYTAQKMDTVNCYAIASRDLGRAQDMADKFGFEKAYGSYEELLNDSEVELVYIATPHSHHGSQIEKCLEAGKHVLCEKAFTKTAGEAEYVIKLAEEKKLLLAEAIWPRYMPMAKTIKDFCKSGKIGEIRSLTCNLGYNVSFKERIQDPNLAGGALLDVGIYPLTFASIVFGNDVKNITATAVFNEKGVDMQNSVTLEYEQNVMASLFSTVTGKTDRMGVIYGEKGFAIIDNINNFESIRVYDDDYRLTEKIDRPQQITGYEYEIQACADAIHNGKLECEDMPHKEILEIMNLLDSIRHKFGLFYPGETKNA